MASEFAQAARATTSSLPRLVPGAPRTLEDLYDEYADFVYRSLISLGVDPTAAEDGMQEVFMVAHRRLPEFQGAFFKAWLFRIAVSMAQNLRRSWWRRNKRSAPLELHDVPDERTPGPFERVAEAERIALLQMMLEQLDAKEREVFILSELEQISQAHIAESLGVHVNTVAYRLRGAKERLNQLIKAHHARARGRT